MLSLLGLTFAALVMGMLSNALEGDLLTWAFRPATAAPTRPTGPLKVGLSSTAPTEAGGNITEPAFTGYARQDVVFGAPVSGDPTTVSNTADVSFGDPDADGSASHFVVWDAAGNVLAYGALGATVNYQASVNDPLSFPAGSLVLSLD